MIFGGNLTPSFGNIGFSNLDLGFAAVTWTDPKNTVTLANGAKQATSATIYLQSNHLSSFYYVNQTPQFLAKVLVHELGHVFNDVGGLGGSKIVSDVNPNGSANDDAQKLNEGTVTKNCKF
jgi:hypothetical protein